MLIERFVERSSGEMLAGDQLAGAIHLSSTAPGAERENLAEALVQRLDRPMQPEPDPFAVLIADLRSGGLDPDAVRLADARWVAGNLSGSRGAVGMSTALSAGQRTSAALALRAVPGGGILSRSRKTLLARLGLDEALLLLRRCCRYVECHNGVGGLGLPAHAVARTETFGHRREGTAHHSEGSFATVSEPRARRSPGSLPNGCGRPHPEYCPHAGRRR